MEWHDLPLTARLQKWATAVMQVSDDDSHVPQRYVDTLPPPTHTVEMKIIVLSPSRSATLATYRALQILGYKTYHYYEAVTNGVRDMRLFNEALRASWDGETEAYRRPEFEKWFGGYDAITEIPSYIPRDLVRAYPDAKFILVERAPESWARSIVTCVVQLAEDVNKFPTSFLKQFDRGMYEMCDTAYTTAARFSGGNFARPGGPEACADWYREYIAVVKSIVPPEQLLVVKLEDGLDFSSICPFLGRPVPKEPWPAKNTPDEFQANVEALMMPMVTRAMRNAAACVLSSVALASAGAWWARSRWKSV